MGLNVPFLITVWMAYNLTSEAYLVRMLVQAVFTQQSQMQATAATANKESASGMAKRIKGVILLCCTVGYIIIQIIKNLLCVFDSIA